MTSPGRGSYMSKRGSATAVLASAAIFAVAGCGGGRKGGGPDGPGVATAGTASGAPPRGAGGAVAVVVRWPDAASRASVRAYHSVPRVQAGQGETANVTVQGEGTTSVSVPAGTFQASVVNMTIATRAETVEVTTWIAQGIGVV